MLKITPSPSYWAPVPFYVPGSDEPVIVQFQFKWAPPEDTIAFAQKCQSGDFGDEPVEKILCEHVVSDWRGFDDKFNQENLGHVLKHYGQSAREIIATWMRENAGAKRKNS